MATIIVIFVLLTIMVGSFVWYKLKLDVQVKWSYKLSELRKGDVIAMNVYGEVQKFLIVQNYPSKGHLILVSKGKDKLVWYNDACFTPFKEN